MALEEGESFLVVWDRSREELGLRVRDAAKAAVSRVRTCALPVPTRGTWEEETLRALEQSMDGQDVILFLTRYSLSHTYARRQAVGRGARLASMPGITGEMLIRAAKADYRAVAERSRRLQMIFSSGAEVTVQTDMGTAISFSIQGMEGHMEGGLYNKPGRWGNMPAGEASIGPREKTAHGHIVIDWSMSGIGRLGEPLYLRIEKGVASGIAGRHSAEVLERLRSHGDAAFTLAEFGVGTNDSTRLGGTVLEDEKTLGTVHLALGNNISFGGSVDVPVHLDGVLTKPTVHVDGMLIMEKGRPLWESLPDLQDHSA
jgi:leucyl aminopeptidase (aminopeptidase T)